MPHITYSDKINSSELMQGDVLRRTPELNELLKLVHPHFYQQEKNIYFIVLTQSCDLVRRGESIKASVITLSPVRTLDSVIEKHLAAGSSANIMSDIPVRPSKIKGKATEFLQRLLNNNEQGMFYLDSEDTPLSTDCVALLNLSIAVKTDLHYQTCLSAKILQLTDTFQAKLGWLVGQMYSRVGTQDWDTTKLGRKITSLLQDAATWVDDSKIRALESAFQALVEEKPGTRMSARDIEVALRKAPTRKSQAIEQAVKVISGTLNPDQHAIVEKIRRRLESDSALTSLLK